MGGHWQGVQLSLLRAFLALKRNELLLTRPHTRPLHFFRKHTPRETMCRVPPLSVNYGRDRRGGPDVRCLARQAGCRLSCIPQVLLPLCFLLPSKGGRPVGPSSRTVPYVRLVGRDTHGCRPHGEDHHARSTTIRKKKKLLVNPASAMDSGRGSVFAAADGKWETPPAQSCPPRARAGAEERPSVRGHGAFHKRDPRDQLSSYWTEFHQSIFDVCYC